MDGGTDVWKMDKEKQVVEVIPQLVQALEEAATSYRASG